MLSWDLETQRAYALADAFKGEITTPEARKILFGQTAKTIHRA